MSNKLVHCTVVEVESNAHLLPVDAKDPPRDLLPWADPYIAQLLTKYRLQAALDDSLRFVSSEAARGLAPTGIDRGAWTLHDPPARFTVCQSRLPRPPKTEDRPLE